MIRLIFGGSRTFTVQNSGTTLIGGTLPASPNTSLNADGSATFAGNVGIGTLSPTFAAGGGVQASFATFSAFRATAGSKTGIDFAQSDGGDGFIYNRDNAALIFGTSNSQKAQIDASGRLLVGTPTPRVTEDAGGFGADNALIQIEGAGSSTRFSIIANSNTDATRCATVILGRSRGTAVDSNDPIQDGDRIGAIVFSAADGTDIRSRPAQIFCEIDGPPSGNDTPGRLVFATTPAGVGQTPTERMRISQNGNILFEKTALSNTTAGIEYLKGGQFSIVHSDAGGSQALFINRQESDGDLILFRQGNATEGAISVSGNTVTYGGGHLARWSQLPNQEDPSSLLKGTVMSNLDEMCEWGEEDNEQLNKTKVSDVEGDPNVAGVFVSTSFSDDGPLDYFCAMTGDMIIRIAEGVTVQRGDLLMSAGDGTAKPQDDDIIRSKTIAKVTSTHVSETYADGSYCVPCVLMAC